MHRSLVPLLLAVLTLLAVAGGARAQTVIDFDEDLATERPEAWAMRYFGSLVAPTGFGPAARLAPGGVVVGVEAGWIPHLDREQRTVGFNGTKEEDLNRSEVLGRLRVAVGLPGGFTLGAAYVPPVEIDRLTPHLLALGLERPVLKRRAWSLGLRLSAQYGTFEGDLTCSRDAAEAGDDPVRNPFRCLAPSNDEMTLRAVGVELSVGRRAPQGSRLSPYAGLGAHYFDHELRLDSRYGTIIDHSGLLTDGIDYWASAGLGVALGERTHLAGELFYSPLEVVRRPGANEENDPLLNVRVLLSYRVR